MKDLNPTKLCHNCFKPHQNMGLYCVQCDKSNKTMNELLEKAKRDYPIGTKCKSVFKDLEFIVTKEVFIHYGNLYTIDNIAYRCIYDKAFNKWAEIIKEESQSHIQDSFRYYIGGFSKHNLNQNTMTQQEFNSLEVGEFISNYEIRHKFKEFLIVRCDDGHDLFDLNKINKLGLKVKPKTFMGLEIKEYDNVPCEIDNRLYYLIEVTENEVVFKQYKKQSTPYFDIPTSIRIL